MNIKHGQTICHSKAGNICCKGCYVLGLKDGKQETLKQVQDILDKWWEKRTTEEKGASFKELKIQLEKI